MSVRRVLEQAASEARRADACADCRHLEAYDRCGAYRLSATLVRMRTGFMMRCPAFERRPPPPPPGALRRFWRWLW
jgi:hypothetical protein